MKKIFWLRLCVYVHTCVYIYIYIYIYTHTHTYRVIRKSPRDFRPLLYSSRNGHAEGKHVNRGRDTPSFCPTLQVLNMSTLGDAADVKHVIKFLPHTCRRRACQQRERHSKFLSYLTGSQYVHPWWRGRCQSCNQVPATHVARVWQELDYRVDICHVTKGGHIENL